MPAPAELIAQLASDDVAVRRAAAEGLYELGAVAVPSMIEALRRLGPSPPYALLSDTLRRLGHVAFGPVRDALAVAATREERGTFARIFVSLAESALPDYAGALRHPRTEIRLGSIAGIGNLREAALPEAAPVAALLGDADEQIRAAASRALVKIGTGAVPLLQEIRAAGPGRARPAALYCLAEIGGEQVLSDRDRRALERLVRLKLLDDHPMPVTCCFLTWMAVESTDQRAVMRLFDLTPSWPAPFSLGIAAADHDGHRSDDPAGRLARVFVTPPVEGFTLLVGAWCNLFQEERRDDVLDLCVRASAVFGRAQAYWYGAQCDGSAWLVAEHGTLIRRAANIDAALDEEIALGEPLPYEAEVHATAEKWGAPEDDEDEWGSDLFDFAPLLAARLSIDPLALSAETTWQGHGWLALTPIGVRHGPPPGALKFRQH
jgi:hypothetical protein